MTQVDFREIKNPKNPNISVILPDFAVEHIEALIQQKQLEAIDSLHASIMRGELPLGNETDHAFNYARIHRWIDASKLSTPPKKEAV